jgi:hypothetical protein
MQCVLLLYLLNTAGRFYENWRECYFSGNYISVKPHRDLHSVITKQCTKSVGREPHQLYERGIVIGCLVRNLAKRFSFHLE